VESDDANPVRFDHGDGCVTIARTGVFIEGVAIEISWRDATRNLSELIFSTYQNAGLRIYDIKDQFRPKEVAAFVPPPPKKWVDPRPNRPVVLRSGEEVEVSAILNYGDPTRSQLSGSGWPSRDFPCPPVEVIIDQRESRC